MIRMFNVIGNEWTLTDLGDGQSDGHRHTDEEGGEQDLGEQDLGVSFGTVEPLDDETMELT